MITKTSYIYSAKVLKVVDGDTLDLLVDLGFRLKQTIRVRLEGIDAFETTLRSGTTPEQKELGIKAKKLLETFLLDTTVLIETSMEIGSFGRWLARIYIPDNLVYRMNCSKISNEQFSEILRTKDSKENLIDINELLVLLGYAVHKQY